MYLHNCFARKEKLGPHLQFTHRSYRGLAPKMLSCYRCDASILIALGGYCVRAGRRPPIGKWCNAIRHPPPTDRQSITLRILIIECLCTKASHTWCPTTSISPIQIKVLEDDEMCVVDLFPTHIRPRNTRIAVSLEVDLRPTWSST